MCLGVCCVCRCVATVVWVKKVHISRFMLYLGMRAKLDVTEGSVAAYAKSYSLLKYSLILHVHVLAFPNY